MTKKRVILAVALVLAVGVVAALWDTGQYFDSAGVRIHYTDQGKGEPVVLVHGFLASYNTNWRWPGVIRALRRTGYRVIALDCRGHGRSGKPRETEQYGLEMVNDVVRLLDHADIDRAHVVGYSMGGLITNRLRAEYPERLLTATLGGMGWAGEGVEDETLDSRDLAEAMEKNDLGPLFQALAPPGEPGPGRTRIFLMNTALLAFNDPQALAAALRGFDALGRISAQNLVENRVPTLALVGDQDPLLQQVETMAAVMSNLEVVEIPGATHMTAFSDPLFTETLVAFLGRHRST